MRAYEQPSADQEPDGDGEQYVAIGNLALLEPATIEPPAAVDTVTSVQIPTTYPETRELHDWGPWLRGVPREAAQGLRDNQRVTILMPRAASHPYNPADNWAYQDAIRHSPANLAFLDRVVPRLEEILNNMRQARGQRMLTVQAAFASIERPIHMPAGYFGRQPLHLYVPDVPALLYLPPGHTAADINLRGFGHADHDQQPYASLSPATVQWLLHAPRQTQGHLRELGAAHLADQIHGVLLVRDTEQLIRDGASLHKGADSKVWSKAIIQAYILPSFAA